MQDLYHQQYGPQRGTVPNYFDPTSAENPSKPQSPTLPLTAKPYHRASGYTLNPKPCNKYERVLKRSQGSTSLILVGV